MAPSGADGSRRAVRVEADPVREQLRALLRLDQVQSLINALYASSGVPFSIIDTEGNVIVGTRWQDICSWFHRANPASRRRCLESNRRIMSLLDAASTDAPAGAASARRPPDAASTDIASGNGHRRVQDDPPVLGVPSKVFVDRCANGLWDMAVPLTVEGVHIGAVFVGQFILAEEDPGQEYFLEQARRFGYPEREYLEVLAPVPRIPRERAESIGRALATMAPLLIEYGRQELRHDARTRALRESEAWSKALLDQAVDEIMVHDHDGRIIEANRAACTALGYSREELLRLAVVDVDPGALPRRDVDVFKSGRQVTFESSHRRKDGSEYSVEVRLSPIEANGQRAVLGLAHDISARLEAEARERERVFWMSIVNEFATELLHETTPAGVCAAGGRAVRRLLPEAYVSVTHLTADGKRFVTVEFLGLEGMRDAIRAIIGSDPTELVYDVSEMPQERMRDFVDGRLHWLEGGVHELSVGRLPKRVARTAEKLAGIERVYTIGFPYQGKYYGGISIFARKGCPVEERAEAIETISRLCSVALSRALGEQIRTASEERYRGIFENSILGLYRSTPDGRLESCNPAAARMYGYETPEELISSVSDLAHDVYARPEDRDVFRRRLELEGELIDFEREQVRRDGTHFWLRSNDIAIRDKDGKLLCFEGTLEDVSAEHVAREELGRSRARERERAHALQVVAQTVARLVAEDESVAIFKIVGEGIRELLPTATVLTSRVLPDGDRLQLVQAAGAESLLARARKLLGFDPMEMTFEIGSIPDAEFRRYRAARLFPIEDGLHTLCLGKVPRPVCRALERMAHVSQVWSIGLVWGERHYGSLSILAGEGEDVAAHAEAIETLVHQTAIALQRSAGRRALAESESRLWRALQATADAMGRLVETRDPYTAGHERRVAALAEAIATEMGLGESVVGAVRMAGTMHDVGKVSVPAEILTKPAKLSEIEFDLVKHHSQIGHDILESVEFDWPLAEIVLQHHERLDGSGYPRGLSDGDICIEARILTVADVVEAMSSHRPYRPALGMEAALQEIQQQRGRLYDPAVVDACTQVLTAGAFEFPD